jgi:hypothetical protein
MRKYPKINENSKKLAQMKRPADVNIYDRLYGTQLEKAKIARRKEQEELFEVKSLIQHQESQRVQNKTPSNKINYGERMFRKGLIKQEEKEQKLRQQALALKQREMEDVTFKPNTHKHELVKGLKQLNSGSKSLTRINQREVGGAQSPPNGDLVEGHEALPTGTINKSLRVSPKGVRREELLLDYGRMVHEKKERAAQEQTAMVLSEF